MKQIFIDVTAKLSEHPKLMWIDENKNQMNVVPGDRPPITFPAALVTLSYATNDLSRKTQQGQGILTVNLCFDFMGNTNQLTPAASRNESLKFYDTVDEVHALLQGFSTENFNALSRKRVTPVQRMDGYKEIQLQYSFEFQESLGGA